MSYETPETWAEKFFCKECGSCIPMLIVEPPPRDFVHIAYCSECHTQDYVWHIGTCSIIGHDDIWDHLGRNSSAQERRQRTEPWIFPKSATSAVPCRRAIANSRLPRDTLALYNAKQLFV